MKTIRELQAATAELNYSDSIIKIYAILDQLEFQCYYKNNYDRIERESGVFPSANGWGSYDVAS
jgi:hypothetical protein